MTLSASTIKSAKGSRKTKKRVGRGNASGRGTYSTRGLKGQRSRSGGKGGLKVRGLKQALQKVPKVRGFKSLKPPKQTVTLAVLSRVSKEGETVTPYMLEKLGVIKKARNGVKVVAGGELSHSVNLKGCVVTKKALEIIEKKGGKVTF